MNKISKLGYYLAISYYDIPFRIFFGILTAKLVLFTYMARLGIDSFLPSFGAILITLSLSLMIKSNTYKIVYLLILDLIYSLVFFTHSLYLKYFDDLASVYNMSQVYQLPSVSNSVISILGEELFFVLDIVFLPLYLIKLKQNRNYDIRERINVSIILSLLGLQCNINPLIDYVRSDDLFESVFYRHTFVVYNGIINYQIADIYSYLTREIRRERLTQDEINLVKEWNKRHNRSFKENNLTGIVRGGNLIIIQVESLQNFVIGKKYNGREITPNLNQLAKKGIYFNNIYDQTAAGNSSDTTLLANASLHPARKGAASFLYAGNCFDSLSNVLREHGYTTAAMHAYYKNYWNSLLFEKALGFERQYYKDDYIMTEKIGWGLSDKAFFPQSLEKIKELPPPFYVFMRTLSTHGPFDYITEDIDNFPLQGQAGKHIGNYIRSMHYIDSAIGEFLHKLSESNLLSDTVIVIYGDHRARLSEREVSEIGVTDMREIKKIPLIISIPGRKQADERDTIGGLIDMTPTVCNILGIDISDKFFVGKDLGNGDASYTIFRDGSYLGSIEKTSVQQQTLVSDLILEKDVIRLIKGSQGCR